MKARITCILLLAAAMAACNKPGPHVGKSPAVEAEEAVIADSDDKPASPAHADDAQPEAGSIADAGPAKPSEARIGNLLATAKRQQAKLHADNCSTATVDDVETWWNSLSGEDQDICKQSTNFDFGTATQIYKQFFNAKTINDVNKIQKSSKKLFFSPRQQKVIYYYTISNKLFHDMYNIFGMQFEEPIALGFVQK